MFINQNILASFSNRMRLFIKVLKTLKKYIITKMLSTKRSWKTNNKEIILQNKKRSKIR